MLIAEDDFKSYIEIKLGLAKESIRHDICRLRIINNWFKDKKLTKGNVERFFYDLKQRGLKNNSLNTYYSVFSHIKNYRKDRGLSWDFFEGFKYFKKTKPDIVIFTKEEIANILNTSLEYGHFRGKDVSFLDFRYKTLTRFLAETGCRFSEAANLKFKHLDLGSGKATFIETKTNENRTVYITGPLVISLKELTIGFKPEDLVFRNAAEGRIHPQDYITNLKKKGKNSRYYEPKESPPSQLQAHIRNNAFRGWSAYHGGCKAFRAQGCPDDF